MLKKSTLAFKLSSENFQAWLKWIMYVLADNDDTRDLQWCANVIYNIFTDFTLGVFWDMFLYVNISNSN